MEAEHIANLNMPDGEVLKVTTENLRLYTHMGKYALFDHLFYVKDGEHGMFIWANYPPDNESYANLAPLAVSHGIEMHINQRQATQGDMDTFERHSLVDKDETPDWLPPVN